MKRVGITLLALGISSILIAQESGKITYKETATFDLPVIEGMDSAMIANLPRTSSSVKEVYFTAEHSLYQDVPKMETPESMLEEQPGVVIKMDSPDNKCYVNFEDKKIVKQEDFMGRMFLIEDNLEAPQWKLSGKQEKIQGFMCQEAVIEDSTQSMSIWFAPQLQPAVGPGQFVGYPGAVLRVDMDHGRIVIEATSIEKMEIDKGIIKKPKEGKKISQEEFMAIREEKMREMQEQYGGNGNVIIKVERR